MHEKLHRKGNLATDKDGSFVIMDEEGKAYKTDNVIAVVWLKSDGRTAGELADDICSYVKDMDKEVVKQAVETIVADLKKVDLIA